MKFGLETDHNCTYTSSLKCCLYGNSHRYGNSAELWDCRTASILWYRIIHILLYIQPKDVV